MSEIILATLITIGISTLAGLSFMGIAWLLRRAIAKLDGAI